MVSNLSNLYRVVVERLSVPQRKELVEEVNECVERGLGTVDAFLPFLFQDPDTGIISTAALNFALLGPVEHGDPLTAPRYLKGIADLTRHPRVRVGILTGLLLLGDRRVLPVLHRCWVRLTAEERQRLTQAYSGFVYAGVVDFFLDWLEDADEETFGLVAAALAKMPLTAISPKVLDVERVFPAASAGSGPSVRLVGEWPFEEYGRLIEPRFRDLLRRKSEPWVLSQVMAAWGLQA